jgi:hypothetical protein
MARKTNRIQQSSSHTDGARANLRAPRIVRPTPMTTAPAGAALFDIVDVAIWTRCRASAPL